MLSKNWCRLMRRTPNNNNWRWKRMEKMRSGYKLACAVHTVNMKKQTNKQKNALIFIRECNEILYISKNLLISSVHDIYAINAI